MFWSVKTKEKKQARRSNLMIRVIHANLDPIGGPGSLHSSLLLLQAGSIRGFYCRGRRFLCHMLTVMCTLSMSEPHSALNFTPGGQISGPDRDSFRDLVFQPPSTSQPATLSIPEPPLLLLLLKLSAV